MATKEKKRVINKKPPETVEAQVVESKEITTDQAIQTLQSTLEKDLTATQRLELLNRTMFKGFTPIEISLTVQKIKAIGANILAGEAWAYKDHKGNLIVIASHSFLLKMAEKNPEYDGLQSGVVCKSDEFSMNTITGEANHLIKSFSDRGEILGGWAIVWRKNGKPLCVLAKREDYDKNQYIWNSHKYAMMTKATESIALRKFANLGDVLGEWEYTPEDKSQLERPKKPDLSKMDALNQGK